VSVDTARFGQIALTGSAQQLTGLGVGATGGIDIKAHSGNSGPVYLGSDNTVSSTTGRELSPGESITLDVLNPRKLWIIGTAADRISWASQAP